MPEADIPMFQTLLSLSAGMLALLLLLVWRISRRLARIEHRFNESPSAANPDAQTPTAAETATGGAFETFLNENPSRRDLPKAEQFAAYRKWRQEKGLNWSGS